MQRSLGGATALEGLQTQQQGAQTTANTLNQQDTATQQAALTAQYNQWLMAQQYPFQTAQCHQLDHRHRRKRTAGHY